MSRSGKEAVRAKVLGADRAFRVIDGGSGGGGSPPAGPAGRDDDPCPVIPLGDSAGVYHFLDTAGQAREFSARQLGSRTDLLSLFRGDNSWLLRRFPVKKEVDDGEGGKKSVTVDFRITEAARHMILLASAQGLLGQRLKLRKSGIWRGQDGLPVVHCGDGVLIDDAWHDAGTRTGDQIWVACERTPRPSTPCDYRVGQQLQRDLQEYWAWQNAAGPIAVMGLLYSGYVCGALQWRSNAFVTGGSGSGKSSLRRVIRAAWPVHDYSNDTSKAGMEQTIAGRAIPSIIDEANDRNRSSGRDLVDIVLSASGDEGTKLARGTSDGRGRAAEVVSNVVMFSINAPALEPQHLNRFVILELLKPQGGEDYSREHRQLAEYVASQAPALWGRAIASFERYQESLTLFRRALAGQGCGPREMDGKGALLAGWFVLTHEGLPDDADLREGIAALGEFIVSSREASADDGPRRVIQQMLGYQVQLHRGTDKDPIGVLLDFAFAVDQQIDTDVERRPSTAARVLSNNGIRPVRACGVPPDKRQVGQCRCASCWDTVTGKPVPRLALADGLWLSPRSPELAKVFQGTPFDDGRWQQEVLRLPSAQRSKANVRIGGASGRAIWLDRSDLHEPDD